VIVHGQLPRAPNIKTSIISFGIIAPLICLQFVHAEQSCDKPNYPGHGHALRRQLEAGSPVALRASWRPFSWMLTLC
jgi:hypothetical protein